MVVGSAFGVRALGAPAGVGGCESVLLLRSSLEALRVVEEEMESDRSSSSKAAMIAVL